MELAQKLKEFIHQWECQTFLTWTRTPYEIIANLKSILCQYEQSLEKELDEMAEYYETRKESR